jgi:hypothetical protein
MEKVDYNSGELQNTSQNCIIGVLGPDEIKNVNSESNRRLPATNDI